ncbi:MAG: hypothetical protein WDW38_011523 [Sanguina aurantia]
MAAVNVISVNVLDNPGPFGAPLRFQIEYECQSSLVHDLEWKMVYIGSAQGDQYDQELESVLVGPVLPGVFRFVFEGDAPDPSKIPEDDLVDMTAVMLTCSYQNQEFIRIGYYCNIAYESEELKANPPSPPLISLLTRNIFADDVRVTKFLIPFDNPEPVDAAGGGEAPDDGVDGMASDENGGGGSSEGDQEHSQDENSGMMEEDDAPAGAGEEGSVQQGLLWAQQQQPHQQQDPAVRYQLGEQPQPFDGQGMMV